MSANQQVLATSFLGVTPPGQQVFTSSGTWVCPAGVTSVSVVCVGAGGTSGGSDDSGYGSGGGLGYKNNITVVPGNSYTVNVSAGQWSPGAASGSYFISSATVFGKCGAQAHTGPTAGGTFVGDGGGNGGDGRYSSGGAGGYSGKGGDGLSSSAPAQASNAGAGGGAAGGCISADPIVFKGGGVGLLGQGTSGASDYESSGGSGGANGSATLGGNYGGGGSGGDNSAGAGAVRIIWPGDLRQFPSTRTADE